EETETGTLVGGVSSTQRPRRILPLWIAGVLAVVVVAAVGVFLAPRGGPSLNVPPPPRYPGSGRRPFFPPDGYQVAFSWNGEKQDNYDIYVKVVNGASPPLRLTRDSNPDLAPAWSPDGRWIAFLRKTGDAGAVFLVSPLGGPERRLTDAS